MPSPKRGSFCCIFILLCSFIDTPLCLIIEFAALGSLKHFLTQCKQNTEKMSKTGPMTADGRNSSSYYNESKVMQSIAQSATTQPLTQPMTQAVTQPMTHYINTDDNWYMYQRQSADSSTPEYYNNRLQCLTQKDYTNVPGRLSIIDIYYFLLQIAKGMDHIGKTKVSGSYEEIM